MSKPVVDAAAWMERFGMFPPPGGTILCAVSGGRDSVCLLDYLWRLGQERGFSVAAAHLNHGMRPTAQRDEELVRRLCRQRDIPFYTEKVDVYALCGAWRLTVEETGRRARYEFLRRTAASIGAAFIATAHHREDQAETVLLQLLRGTGPQGLAGIPPVREGIIRPLLDTPRAAIDAYIAAHDLPYVTDETNLDTHYARNRLRLEIMPQLLTINPSAPDHICRTADILRAENDYLDAQAAALLPDTGTALPCHTLLSAPAALRPRMLRLLAERLPVGKKDFSAAHYRALETGNADAGGSRCDIPGGDASPPRRQPRGRVAHPPQRHTDSRRAGGAPRRVERPPLAAGGRPDAARQPRPPQSQASAGRAGRPAGAAGRCPGFLPCGAGRRRTRRRCRCECCAGATRQHHIYSTILGDNGGTKTYG